MNNIDRIDASDKLRVFPCHEELTGVIYAINIYAAENDIKEESSFSECMAKILVDKTDCLIGDYLEPKIGTFLTEWIQYVFYDNSARRVYVKWAPALLNCLDKGLITRAKIKALAKNAGAALCDSCYEEFEQNYKG